jgi:gas vesicle protein
MSQKSSAGVSGGAMLFGFVIGLLVGAIWALLRAPRRGVAVRPQLGMTGQNLASTSESATIVDLLKESLNEGRTAARRRRKELGYE